MMSRKELGFTLIELLVVVAIVVVLVALLVPALSESRRVAKQAACGSNLKQLGQAAHMYSGENDNILVLATAVQTQGIVGSINGDGTKATWLALQTYVGATATVKSTTFEGGLLSGYMKTYKSVLCPETMDYILDLRFTTSGTQFPTSYSLTGRTTYPNPVRATKLITQITNPQETALAGDALHTNSYSSPGGFSGVWGQVINPNALNSGVTSDEFQGRHANNAGNVAFWDAHVESLVVYPRPLASYSGTIYPGEYDDMTGARHFGPLTPSAPDYSSVTNNATYVTLCRPALDQYFITNK